MHINFKYFIVSIGSIFLALGIGILVGSNLSTNEAIQKQNAAIVKDIDGKFSELKKRDDELTKKNKMLESNLKNIDSLVESNYESYVNSKLSGKKIALISFNEGGAFENINAFIDTTGASKVLSLNINESSINDENLIKVNEKFGTSLAKKEDLVKLISESIMNSNKDGRLDLLQELGLVKIIGINGDFLDVDTVVFCNSTSKEKGETDVEFALADTVKAKKHVIVVQNSSSTIDLSKKFSKIKIASLSNIDEKIGQITLVNLILKPEITGNFGKIMDGYSLVPNQD